jgi:hypothetical protein
VGLQKADEAVDDVSARLLKLAAQTMFASSSAGLDLDEDDLLAALGGPIRSRTSSIARRPVEGSS